MKQILIVVLFMVSVIQMVNLSSRVHPLLAQSTIQDSLRIAAIKQGLGDPGVEILKAISLSAAQTGLPKELLLSLMYSESSFRHNAISKKNYQGLMQIPHSDLLLHKEPDVNTLIGAKILVEKLALTQGNVKEAIVLYKGWKVDDKEGQRQAEKVIALARKLKEN